MTMRTRQVDDRLAAAFLAAGVSETVAVMGHCTEKGCKHGVRLDIHGVEIVDPSHPLWHYAFTSEFDRARFNVPEGKGWVSGPTYLLQMRKTFICPDHGYAYEFKGLHVVLTHTTCDIACMEATGAECHCSCGGANHGVSA